MQKLVCDVLAPSVLAYGLRLLNEEEAAGHQRALRKRRIFPRTKRAFEFKIFEVGRSVLFVNHECPAVDHPQSNRAKPLDTRVDLPVALMRLEIPESLVFIELADDELSQEGVVQFVFTE